MIENSETILMGLKNKYSSSEWELMYNHPNCPGAAARAMGDVFQFYFRQKGIYDTKQCLTLVFKDRVQKGSLVNYEGGDNTRYLSNSQIDSLINFCVSDLTLIIYSIQFLESELFRIGVNNDYSRELALDVIYSNILLKVETSLITITHEKRHLLAKQFLNDWYSKNFAYENSQSSNEGEKEMLDSLTELIKVYALGFDMHLKGSSILDKENAFRNFFELRQNIGNVTLDFSNYLSKVNFTSFCEELGLCFEHGFSPKNDLASFIFYLLIYESKEFRDLIRGIDENLRKRVHEVFYDTTIKYCRNGLGSSRQQFLEYQERLFHLLEATHLRYL